MMQSRHDKPASEPFDIVDGTIGRRTLLKSAAASLALGYGLPARAATSRTLITNAYVLTMDDHLGDLPGADILIEDGQIRAIGRNLSADDARNINADGAIALPGFIDTHWHMWNQIARNHAISERGGFAPTMATMAPLWSPDDSAAGVRLALAEAINAGITTVHNWAHNIRSPLHARAEYAAQAQVGVRGRFAYGHAQGIAADALMDLADLRQMASEARAPLLSLGVCLRGPDRSQEAIWRQEWVQARALGLPITTHSSYDAASAAQQPLRKLAEIGGLGPDTLIVHAVSADDAALSLMARAGAPLSLSPWTEMSVGYGAPPVARMVASGVTMSLSNDNVVLGGRIDMFAVMRLVVDLAAAESGDQTLVPPRTALRWATIEGARAMGMDRDVGSLRPGKRADLMLIRPAGRLTAPEGPLDRWLTHTALPDQVELVMIDGHVRKAQGMLVDIDLATLEEESRERAARLIDRASLHSPG